MNTEYNFKKFSKDKCLLQKITVEKNGLFHVLNVIITSLIYFTDQI